MMKNRSIIWKAAVAMLVAVLTLAAMPINKVAAVTEQELTIEYNAENRARAKAYYNGLIWCYQRMNDIDDFSMWFALKGKFGAGDGDGNVDTGDNIDDDYLNELRGITERFEDCSTNNLISEAFDFFATISDSKPWSQWTLDDKILLFCGPNGGSGNGNGWFLAGYDTVGTNDFKRDCGADMRFVAGQSSNSGKVSNYAFETTKTTGDGLDYLASFVRDNIFKGRFDPSKSYTDDEKYYMHRSLLTRYCAEGKGGGTVDPHSDDYSAVVSFKLGEKELYRETQFWEIEHTHANAQWYNSKSNGRDVSEHEDDCNSGSGNLSKVLDSKDDTEVKAAQTNLVNYLKADCTKNYEDFYAQQTDYYNGLTSEQKSGDEAAFVEWYKKLPTTPLASSCYVLSEENPIFKCTVEDYVNELLKTKPESGSPEYEGYYIEPPAEPVSEEPVATEANCYTNAGSLGWIVCPMITTGAEMVQKTYEGMVVPYLRMDPRLFASNSDNGTYIAWNVFRNIANLAFVIVFLVVIFSQLTGLGIDNYGIKKILPKLVVAAILINLSYIICQLAIDIANIVGSGIGSLFVRIGNDIMATPPSYCIGANGSSCMAASAGSAGGAGGWIALIAVVGAITVTAVLALGPQILIPVFLAILGIVIAVFFLFVVLGIRQAVAVLLVVASPLAFLCYMLPNTKKVFDRWLSTLKGILVAYPVCSAMVYGGDMAAKILITSYRDTPTDLATLTPVLAAGIIAIAPIFLIPTVMKKSMGGIGMIASRISGSARHRATHAAGNGLRKLPFNNPDNNKFFGFGARAMHQHSRYKKQQREDNIAARQSEYNAKKGEKVLYGKKGLAAMAAAGTLSASQKRQYNRALGAVNAERDSNVSTYTSSYKSMGSDDNIISSVQNSLDNGSLTADQFAAAVQAVHDEDKVAELLKLNSASGDNVLSKFKGTGADKVNNRQKIADALTSRKGNIFAQSAGKLVNTGAGDGMDFRDMTSGSNALMAKIQGAGDDVMASQDKDVFKIDGMGQMLSASQLAAGVGAGYSGSTAGNFNAMLYNSGRGNEVLDNLSADQLSRVSAQEYSGKDSSGAATSYSVMQALGGDSNTTNAANNIKANTNASTLIDSLNSTSGAQARSTMDVSTMGHLGVKNGSEVVSTSQYTDASGAGDHTIVQKSDGAFYRIDHGVDPATGAATTTETKVDIRDYKKK